MLRLDDANVNQCNQSLDHERLQCLVYLKESALEGLKIELYKPEVQHHHNIASYSQRNFADL